jgi:hypothetical protein
MYVEVITMREKFVPEFHDCLRKAGIDEDKFMEIMKSLVQEYEKKALRERANQDNSKSLELS